MGCVHIISSAGQNNARSTASIRLRESAQDNVSFVKVYKLFLSVGDVKASTNCGLLRDLCYCVIDKYKFGANPLRHASVLLCRIIIEIHSLMR